MTQIKLRRDTSANFTSANPVLGVGEPAYETDTKKLKIGDGTTAYNSLTYFSMTDELATYREQYGAPSDSVPVVNTGNSITIKAGVSIETPNGTLTNTTDMTYTYDFLTDRVLFVTENDYYHAYAVYYGGKEPSPVGEQIFWFNNNVWTMISGNGTKTVFNTQKITPIAKIYQVNGTVKNIDYSSYTKTSTGGGGSTNISATLPLKIVDGVISLEVDGQTIQIVDGKLHANLDDKQDKFETQVPLSISSSSITTSVETGITETAESWTGGGPDKFVYVNISALNIDANSDWRIHLSGYMGNYRNTTTNTNTLIISTEHEQIFRVWFGSRDFRLGNGTSPFKRIPDSNREFFYEIVHQNNGTEFTFNGTSLINSKPLPISEMSREIGGQTPYTTLAGKGKLKTISLVINSYQFQRIDKDISKSYFEADGVKYPITSVEGINTLNLNIGSGLSVVDGKLTASSTAPANMVTTDTAQTISGQKEFNRAILFLGNGDLIRGQQSSSYRNGAGLSMGANTTSTDGGVFAPQWKIYNTAGGVDRTETIITTYNQSELNSSNFNTANKLVKLDSNGKLPAVDGSNLTNLPGGGSAPTNMVTTDTSQTITGLKTFGGTDLSKILLEGNESLIGFRQNIDSLPTTLIGGFFDSNGKKSITIGSTDHETLSLNAKSVQDGSGNKFLTSGNVTAYITETYKNGTSWYRVWSDGWCEQGGYNSNNLATINLLKQYTDTNYIVITTILSESSSGNYYATKVSNKTTSNFIMAGNEVGSMWQTSGYVR